MTEGFGNFKTRVQFNWVQTDGAMTISFYMDGGTNGFRQITVAAGQTELPVSPDFKSYVFRIQYTAANSVRLLRGMWARNKVDSKGGT